MNNATLVDTMVNDALWDAFNQYHMGITAENVAEKWGLYEIHIADGKACLLKYFLSGSDRADTHDGRIYAAKRACNERCQVLPHCVSAAVWDAQRS